MSDRELDDYTTKELVEELKDREGVKSLRLGLEDNVSLKVNDKGCVEENIELGGPSILLEVID